MYLSAPLPLPPSNHHHQEKEKGKRKQKKEIRKRVEHRLQVERKGGELVTSAEPRVVTTRINQQRPFSSVWLREAHRVRFLLAIFSPHAKKILHKTKAKTVKKVVVRRGQEQRAGDPREAKTGETFSKGKKYRAHLQSSLCCR